MSVRSEIIRLLDGITLLGGRNFADERPEGETLPHTVTHDGVGFNHALAGDSKVMFWHHMAQIDLWEDANAASQATRDAVVAALEGQPISGSMRLRVSSVNRVYDPDRQLAHTAITLGCMRTL